MSCDSCGHEGTREFCTIQRRDHKGRELEYIVCEVCYSSSCKNALLYPRQCDGTTLRAIADCTNMLLDALEKRS